jgi:6-pyruvoyltetrahydropterin/6-carboxytetrahydropterin synthase
MNSKETYAVAVRREFTAQHYLIGGDWGAENERHEHQYAVEVRLEGGQLDRHGYLTDIDAVATALEEQVERYRDQTLNSLPEFAGVNPSLERLARIIGIALIDTLATGIESLAVRIWENPYAWAESRKEI